MLKLKKIKMGELEMKCKSIIIFVVIATMLTTSGCGNSKKSQGTSSNASKSPVSTTWFSDVPFWNPPTTWSTDPSTVQGAITQKTGLKFTMNIPAQDADAKLSLLMVSGVLPDVITISDPVAIQKLEKSKKVWKLDDLLKKYDPKSHILTDFPADIKTALVNRDGAWYAWPSHIISKDSAKEYPVSDPYYSNVNNLGNNYGIMFNSKIMSQAGITLNDLKTEDGVLAAFKKVNSMNLKVNGTSVIPMLLDGLTYQNSSFLTLENFFGAMPVDASGNYRDLFMDPITKHSLSFLNTCINNNYVDPNQLTMDNDAVKSVIASGRVFSFIGNTADTFFDANIGHQDGWVSPGPVLSNKGTKPVLSVAQQAGTGWMQTFVSTSAKNPEKIAKWISYMSSVEGLKLTWYGFKGKDYTIDSKGLLIQTTAGLQNTKDYSKTGTGAYWPFANISFTDHVIPAPTKENAPGLLESTTVITALGLSKDTVVYDSSLLTLPNNYIDSNSDIGLIQTEIKNYKLAQIAKVVMAKNDSSFNSLYNDMIKKLKDLGQDKVDSKINDQVQKNYKTYNSTLKAVNP